MTKLQDLSPADRRRIKAGRLSTGAVPSTAFSIKNAVSSAPERSEASVDVTHMKCHTCAETFTAQTGKTGWETHADRTGHRRIELVLEAAP